ncbi:MAG: 5'-methylthioadenosine/S-adenosylhomocysteine nucleosidase family protein [Solirubrobacteraceae bacterium]
MSAPERLLLAAPMRIEASLVSSGARTAHVHRTGIGPERAKLAARQLPSLPGDALVVLGFCGALGRGTLRPGEIVVGQRAYSAADEGREPLSVDLHGSGELAAALRDRGLPARTGEIVCVGRIATGQRREQLHADGALAVEMESAWLAPGAGERPFAVVRVVLDTPEHELFRPRTAPLLWRAGAVLRSVARALERLGCDGSLNTMLRDGNVGRPVEQGSARPDAESEV